MNNPKPYTSLKTAFLAALLAAGVFVFLFFYIGISQRKFTYEDSKQLAKEISQKAASETEIYFASAVQAARLMEQKAVIYKNLKAGRENINNLLLTNLNLNPNFLAIWTMWEHNAYDGKDFAFQTEEIYDTLGNLSVTYFRYKDTVLLEQTQPEDYFEDYYTIPKQTKSELIIEPYFYQYSGFPYVFFETSVVVPIFIDSLFVGVFGIDINLDSLQQKLNQTKLYKSGYLSLISHHDCLLKIN